MAPAAAVMAIASLASTALGAYGSIKAAKTETQLAQAEQAGAEQKAGQEAASGQRRAEERRREGDRLNSQTNAQLAAAGGGNDGAFELMAETAGQANLNARNELYEASERGRGLRDNAALKVAAAQSKQKGAKIGAIGSVLSGVASAYSGYKTNSAPASSTYYG
jgi:hypothetical protein